jgi:pilus assembly protein CpaE
MLRAATSPSASAKTPAMGSWACAVGIIVQSPTAYTPSNPVRRVCRSGSIQPEGPASGEPARTGSGALAGTAVGVGTVLVRTLRAGQLSPREHEVLTMLVEGIRGEDIARRLSLSPNTVRTHVQNILTKLQVHTRLEAATFAVRYGIVSPPGTAGREVALVDLDLESGDLAIMLQTVPSWTIHDAAEKGDLDSQALDGFLEKHSGGVHLLAAPTDPSLAGAVSEEAVRRILHLLRTTYPFVVVDGPSTFTGPMLTALDETDDLVLVGALDVPTIKSTKIALLTLQRLGWSEDRIKLVLNRVEGKVGLQPRDVEKNLGMKVDVSLPTSPDVPLSVNEGVPLALGRNNGEVVSGLAELASRLTGRAPTGSSKARRFWKR